MLDALPPLNVCFLGFCLQTVEELTAASHSSFMEEIIQQSTKNAGNEG
jgi:hypothetical protein